MILGVLGYALVHVWNRTDEDINNISVTFQENFKDRKILIKKIKPKCSKYASMPVIDLTAPNNLVLELENGKQFVIAENIVHDKTYEIVVNITGVTDDGDLIFTTEKAK